MDTGVKTTQTAAEPKAPATPSVADAISQRLRRGELGQLPVVLTLVLIALFFQITSGGIFLNPQNLSNLVLQIATIASLAIGSVFVLLIAEIDLSLAAVANLCGAVMVTLSVYQGWGALPALLAGLVVGALVGVVNGVFVAVLRVPSFIVTLAGLIGYSGLLLHLLLPNTTIRLIDPSLTAIAANYLIFPWDVLLPIPFVAAYVGLVLANRAGRARQGLPNAPTWEVLARTGVVVVIVILALALFESYRGVPYSTLVVVGLLLLFWLILRFSGFGRHVYAVGGSPEASRRAGINVTGIRIAIFALASTMAAVGGILESSRTISASAQVDPTLLLDAIAAAVIGGTSLFGGRGSAYAALLGIIVIQSIDNGLTLLSLTSAAQFMITGGVLMVAVIVDSMARRTRAAHGAE